MFKVFVVYKEEGFTDALLAGFIDDNDAQDFIDCQIGPDKRDAERYAIVSVDEVEAWRTDGAHITPVYKGAK